MDDNQSNIVHDGDSDYATNYRADTIQMQQDGRHILEHVWLWKMVDTDRPYSETKHATIPHKTETASEKEVNEATRAWCAEFLVVGVIIADDPKKLVPTGTSGRTGGPKPQALKASDLKLLRVVAPVTEHIATLARVFVACTPKSGRCYARVTNLESVFFFHEFTSQLGGRRSAKAVRSGIGKVICLSAAVNKSAQSVAAPVVMNDMSKVMSSNPLIQTRAENLSNHIAMFNSLMVANGDPKNIKKIQALIENAAPDLRYGPKTFDAVFLKFLDEDADEYELTDAENFQKHLEVLIGKVSVEDILQVRTILLDNEQLSIIAEEDLGRLFDACMTLKHDPITDTTIEFAIEMVAFSHRHPKLPTEPANCKLSANRSAMVLEGLRGCLQGVLSFISDSNANMTEQHGSVLPYGSMVDLLATWAETLDVAAARSLHTQIAAVHAAQYMANNKELREEIEAMIEYIDGALAM